MASHVNSAKSVQSHSSTIAKKNNYQASRLVVLAGIIGLIAFSTFGYSFNLPNKPLVPGVLFSAFYLKNDTETLETRRIGEEIGTFDEQGCYEDVLYVRSDELDCRGVCTSFVQKKTGAAVNLANRLPSIKGYEIVQNPRKNDIILYLDSMINSTEVSPFTHVGFISKIENANVWVTSKWGSLRCFDHLEEVVPYDYGNAVVYMRKQS